MPRLQRLFRLARLHLLKLRVGMEGHYVGNCTNMDTTSCSTAGGGSRWIMNHIHRPHPKPARSPHTCPPAPHLSISLPFVSFPTQFNISHSIPFLTFPAKNPSPAPVPPSSIQSRDETENPSLSYPHSLPYTIFHLCSLQ